MTYYFFSIIYNLKINLFTFTSEIAKLNSISFLFNNALRVATWGESGSGLLAATTGLADDTDETALSDVEAAQLVRLKTKKPVNNVNDVYLIVRLL